jgi:hypothetical protein
MHNAISGSLMAKWFRVLGDFPPMAPPPPSCNCDSEDVEIPEDLLTGIVIYYAPTNGRIGENLQAAHV